MREPLYFSALVLRVRTRAFSFPLPPSPHTNSARFPYQFGNDCTPIQHTVYANYPPTSHELSTSSLPDFYQLHTELTGTHYSSVLFFPLSPPIASQFLPPFALVPVHLRVLICSRSVGLPCFLPLRSRPISPHNRKARITPGFHTLSKKHPFY